MFQQRACRRHPQRPVVTAWQLEHVVGGQLRRQQADALAEALPVPVGKPHRTRTAGMAGPALDGAPQLALERILAVPSAPRLPAGQAACGLDLAIERPVAQVGRYQQQAIDLVRIRVIVQERAHPAQRNAGQPDLVVAPLAGRRQDFLVQALDCAALPVERQGEAGEDDVRIRPLPVNPLRDATVHKRIEVVATPRQHHHQAVRRLRGGHEQGRDRPGDVAARAARGQQQYHERAEQGGWMQVHEWPSIRPFTPWPPRRSRAERARTLPAAARRGSDAYR
ncbi:hypothetical protein [Frateuria sp.]|uniref:hypothetical protein n=1 Tax=Frateuria sp. TaxID=2211372 RepID=UPI0025C19032|nr:hypothetical protein [Frateuria sp.]